MNDKGKKIKNEAVREEGGKSKEYGYKGQQQRGE
jgi:hypothetical protein